MTGWDEGLGPITPVVKDGKLYGRGGADDGIPLFIDLRLFSFLCCALRQSLPTLKSTSFKNCYFIGSRWRKRKRWSTLLFESLCFQYWNTRSSCLPWFRCSRLWAFVGHFFIKRLYKSEHRSHRLDWRSTFWRCFRGSSLQL